MAKVKIIQAGLLSSIQDLGRANYQNIGMPVGGAMDTTSLQLANYLVGNPFNEACLEITLLGPSLQFLNDACIAVTGGKCQIKLNSRVKSCYKTIKIKAGDMVEIGQIEEGARSYLAIAGGFDVPIIMESKSTYLRGKFGGFMGRALKANDELNFVGVTKNPKRLSIKNKHIPTFKTEVLLRILPGAEKERFNWNSIKNLLTSSYKLTPQCDRMGYRLSGKSLTQINGNSDIVSSAIGFGTIQVPGDGSPIIMMADRQTIGGYTRIGQIISTDHSKLAQLKPGDTIRFQEVSLKEAHRLLREHEEYLSNYRIS